VRQGDTISPKLFNAGLEEVFRRLKWDEVGLKVNGENISHLRFADDIVLIGNNADELQEMLRQLNEESSKLGMKMNMKKTKVIFNKFTRETVVRLNTTEIEKVEEYVYLGQLVMMQNDKTDEIKRRIVAGWIAFNKNRDIMQSKVPMCLKRKVYNQCVLTAMTYGSQTWAITKRMQERLRTTQRSMERVMVGTTRRDRKTNMWLRQQSGVQDIVCRIKQLKWQWAGHIARQIDNRWTKIVTEWIPLQGKRKQGRPTTRWEDDIRKFLGVTWMRKARNRKEWCQQGEAFIQQWI
jgi:Reverse transcriptase (RNA-dependent DNA polymerase)